MVIVTPFPIVGIGASAGGLDAFHRFFEHIPATCGFAFILVQHLPPNRRSLLPEILRRWTSLQVRDGEDGVELAPNCVYVLPPHSIAGISAGRLTVRVAANDERVERPIDALFDALASAVGDRAVGIVLSGTGSDGSLGLKAIKERDGLTLVQGGDGTAPQYKQMPAGAVATGAIDLVAPVERLPRELVRLLGWLARAPEQHPSDPALFAQRLEIVGILRAAMNQDFSAYREPAFLRRVMRRMQVVDIATIDAYIATLRQDHDEVLLLCRDLLMPVTSFLRDAENFRVLETEVIPRLFANLPHEACVRIWVPGCATGEEAYSIAILLREHIDRLTIRPRVQIFATDIDPAAITTARLGRYPATLLDGLSTARRARFFQSSQTGYVVTQDVRDLCTFSTHNVLRDPPFARMDLVSCRNLLIHLDRDRQAALLHLFHYALATRGMLLVGGVQPDTPPGIFESLAGQSAILLRRDVASNGATMPATPAAGGPGPQPASGAPEGSAPVSQRPTAAFARRPWRRRVAARLRPYVERWFAAEADTQSGRPHGVRRDSLESPDEEHHISREELHSINEEMQSTNEQLEASKEELLALNVQLHTVNARLTVKVDELNRLNTDLRNLFDSIDIATVFLDTDLVVRRFTPAMANVYKLLPADLGRPLTDIVSRLDYDQLPRDIAQVLTLRVPLERRVMRADRSAHYLMRILPYREADETVTGVLVSYLDVSSIVQAETALLEANVRKDTFLATLSHELRNPLAPIRTAARLLQSTSLTPLQLERAHAIISRQVTHMSSLLDDLLDVARITRGTFRLKQSAVSLQSVLESALEAAESVIEANHHSVRLECPQPATIMVVDPVRLTQVVSNLLTNAAKYTPPGGLITVGCRHESTGLRIFVRDSGIGIAADQLQSVFTMFTRIESDTHRTDGGLGIGLALARGLVELHGGQLEAHSEGLGHGSEFVITLPRDALAVGAIDDETRPPLMTADPAPVRVMIVDDNRDAAETLGLFLQLQGHDVHTAFNGSEALQIGAVVQPRVCIIDIGMPDMNGYEVARRIRAEVWGQHSTLIALTGWGQESDRRRALAAGFDHHCTKPIDPAQLAPLFAAAPAGSEVGAR